MARQRLASLLQMAVCLSLLPGIHESAAQKWEPEAMSKHPLTDMPQAGSAITNYALPEHPQKQFPAGDVIPIIMGFHNAAATNYTVTAIMGSLNQLNFFNMYIQNFTMQRYGIIIPPNNEVTLEYRFRPDPALASMEFFIAFTVFYEDFNRQQYSSTFFNETVDITEPEKLFDTEGLFMYIMILVLLALAVFGLLRWLGNLSVFKKVAATEKSRTSAKSDTGDDWLAGTPIRNAMKKKQGKRGREREKKTE